MSNWLSVLCLGVTAGTFLGIAFLCCICSNSRNAWDGIQLIYNSILFLRLVVCFFCFFWLEIGVCTCVSLFAFSVTIRWNGTSCALKINILRQNIHTEIIFLFRSLSSSLSPACLLICLFISTVLGSSIILNPFLFISQKVFHNFVVVDVYATQ